MNNLREIANAYGRYLATIFPADNNEKQEFINSYITAEDGGPGTGYPRVKAIYRSISLKDSIRGTPAQPTVAYSETFENDTDRDQTREVSETKTVGYEFIVSVTTGLKISQTHKVVAGIKLKEILNLGGSSEVGMELNLAATASAKAHTTTTWQWKNTFIMPKRRRIECTLFVENRSWDVPWEAEVELNGYYTVEFKHPTKLGATGGSHRTWNLGLDGLINHCKQLNLIDTSGYTVTPDNRVFTYASGKITGMVGTHAHIKIKEYPVSADLPSMEAATGLEYVLPL